MVDIEFRIVSNRRENLLLEIGRIIMASGYVLQRPRMVRTEAGVELSVIVRGPEANLLLLEDRLGSHPLVYSFEAVAPEAPATAADPGVPLAPRARSAAPAPAAEPVTPTPRIEALLAALAADYPNVFDRLIAFERELPAAQRDTTLRYAGTRLGAWIYKRDFALGARLNFADSLKHIVLPAMRHLLRGSELSGDSLRVRNSPFCGLGLQRGASCHFLCGCIEGLLNEPGHLGHVRVGETACRNIGAEACAFLPVS